MKQRDWDKLSDEDKVELLILAMDEARCDSHGGYHSQFVIDHGRVIHADYDERKEYRAVTLSITPIKKWLAENECWKEEMDAQEEQAARSNKQLRKWLQENDERKSGRPEYQSGRPSLSRSNPSGGKP